MTLFDLLFAVLFLSGGVIVIRAAIAAIRGRRPTDIRLVRGVAIGGGLYLAIVAVVSLLSPRRYRAVGEAQCSDDWCISVATALRSHGQPVDTFRLGFRLASRAARISQREQYVVAYLKDGDGHRYDPEPSEGAGPFDILLGPLAVVMTDRLFLVPPEATNVGVVIAREGAGRFPGCGIIGDEGSGCRRMPRCGPGPLGPRLTPRSPKTSSGWPWWPTATFGSSADPTIWPSKPAAPVPAVVLVHGGRATSGRNGPSVPSCTGWPIAATRFSI